MYKIIAFAPDGDYIIEGEFENVPDAWNRVNEWGSRWFFYPITGVLKNKRVVSMCDGYKFAENKTIKTVSQLIQESPF